MEYLAHKAEDKRKQSVEEHLRGTGDIARSCLTSVSLGKAAYLAGMMHDAGKLSQTFQEYIRTEDGKRGSVIHTFQGCRILLERFHRDEGPENMSCELLAYAVGAHHGLFDCIDDEKNSGFRHRITSEKTDYEEVRKNFFDIVQQSEVDDLFSEANSELLPVYERLAGLVSDSKSGDEDFYFYIGLLVRLLLSAVIEGDRRDTADFILNHDGIRDKRNTSCIWDNAICHMESKLDKLSQKGGINEARRAISERCARAAELPTGVYRLNVPTGAGKTLSSLRYALYHARRWGKERIIFTAPLLTILDQNAKDIRDYIGDDSVILEHHSNLVKEKGEPETLDERELLLESWDAPVIITTMVQFLNTLFEGKTSCIRRFHALCNSVIVIDEVQTVPNHMLTLFNLAVNFLSEVCNTTFVLCSATQPLFEAAEHPLIKEPQSLVPMDEALWKPFRRTVLENAGKCRLEDIPAFVAEQIDEVNSLLVVCNKKKEAEYLFGNCSWDGVACYHLSASMCMAHRKIILRQIKTVLQEIKEKVNHQKLLVVATQVIEAGVDISFERVVRLQAGMDSIVQAAGRCNRNGESPLPVPVYIVDCSDESLSHLRDIRAGKTATEEVLERFRRNPVDFQNDLTSDASIGYYYNKLYSHMKERYQDYAVKGETIFSLLSDNEHYADTDCADVRTYFLRQAFKKAGQLFQVFDDTTDSVVVPYREGKKLILELNGMRDDVPLPVLRDWVERAKPYTVSVYQWQKEKIGDGIYEKNGILLLREEFYDENTGVHPEGNNSEFLEV